ncbi:thymidylate kinase [Erwinia phage Derbicus]|uniref:Putative thymidylate kinase n=2 Tax=Derbicusvirus derbicus TaxID=2734104 RepID=A0A482IJ16_9CAUD|nr:thymidylate kinase [Erwinia phage vB_EamM_EarlPhillipIV]YP_009821145.1 thymidylate kinase [Erwinia phage Derbicus]ANZ48950.1 putative thymidylate kinase [Erwinia phage vB_EamM_EarlPhillipIV]QBP07527.1 putative thymidylate kinase [Erwinia phage Derbicus]
MQKPFVIAIGGPDYGGKSTFCKKSTELLAAAGYKAVTIGFPSTSELGLAARASIRASEPPEVQAAKLIADFKHHLNTFGQSDADVIFLDHFVISTIMYQGEAGKAAVFNSAILRHNYAPSVFVEITCDYETMLARAKQRFEEKGETWDDVLTAKYTSTPENWDALVQRSEFAHRIVTDSGERRDWIRLNPHWQTSDAMQLVLKLVNTFEHERQPA